MRCCAYIEECTSHHVMVVYDASTAMCRCTCTSSSVIQLDFIIYLRAMQQSWIQFCNYEVICRKIDNSVKQEACQCVIMKLDYFLMNLDFIYCSHVSLITK